MSMAASLRELLSEPLGTYYDYEILSDECQTSAQRPVELKDVMLEYHGGPIGCGADNNFSLPRTERH